MSGYALHPKAFIDIDEIAAYIGQDSHEAAHRVVDDTYRAIQSAVPFPHGGHRSPRVMAAILRDREEPPAH